MKTQENYNCSDCGLIDSTLYTKMDASQQTDSEMNLTKLQDEVSAGRYVFKQPLVITACGVQDRYVFYTACSRCPKGLSNGVCPVHGLQSECVYRFVLRLLLTDSHGSECWCTCFDKNAVKMLGFTANDYVALATDEQRYESMSSLRGSQVMVVIGKRVSKEYVNYNVTDIDIVTM